MPIFSFSKKAIPCYKILSKNNQDKFAFSKTQHAKYSFMEARYVISFFNVMTFYAKLEF